MTAITDTIAANPIGFAWLAGYLFAAGLIIAAVWAIALWWFRSIEAADSYRVAYTFGRDQHAFDVRESMRARRAA